MKISARSVVAILIDMQKRFIKRLCSEERRKVIAGQIEMIRECAKQDVPLIVLEYYENGPTIDILAGEIRKVPRRHIMTKYHDNGFSGTELNSLLRELRAERLILMGINASCCVRDTANQAIKQHYKIITSDDLISDSLFSCLGKDKDWYVANGTFLPRRPTFKIELAS